jgi:hypothetical protein
MPVLEGDMNFGRSWPTTYVFGKCHARFQEPSGIDERECAACGIGERQVTAFTGYACPELFNKF